MNPTFIAVSSLVFDLLALSGVSRAPVVDRVWRGRLVDEPRGLARRRVGPDRADYLELAEWAVAAARLDPDDSDVDAAGEEHREPYEYAARSTPRGHDLLHASRIIRAAATTSTRVKIMFRRSR
jgi:hypothetical protein